MLKNITSFKDLTDNKIISEMSDNKMINFNDLPCDIKNLIFNNNRPSRDALKNRHKNKLNFKNVLKDIKILCDYKNHNKDYEGEPQMNAFNNFKDYVYHETHMIETRECYDDDDDFKDFKDADYYKYYYSDDYKHILNHLHSESLYYHDEYLYEDGHISR